MRRTMSTAAGLLIATASMTLTLAVIYPSGAEADGEATPGEIQRPTLTVGGCRATLAFAAGSLATGQAFPLHLTVTNPTDAAATVDVKAMLMMQDPTPPFSRRMVMATEAWSEPCQVSLAAGETKTVELLPGVAPKPGQTATLYLQAGDRSIVCQILTVPGELTGAQAPAANVQLQR